MSSIERCAYHIIQRRSYIVCLAKSIWFSSVISSMFFRLKCHRESVFDTPKSRSHAVLVLIPTINRHFFPCNFEQFVMFVFNNQIVLVGIWNIQRCIHWVLCTLGEANKTASVKASETVCYLSHGVDYSKKTTKVNVQLSITSMTKWKQKATSSRQKRQ